jgi:hypothetical protein
MAGDVQSAEFVYRRRYPAINAIGNQLSAHTSDELRFTDDH